jgi:hypothetical protein
MTKKPAEDLWYAIIAAQVKMKEAKECFLNLHEMAWELVLAEQQRAKEKKVIWNPIRDALEKSE